MRAGGVRLDPAADRRGLPDRPLPDARHPGASVWLPSLIVDPLMSLAPDVDCDPGRRAIWYLSVAAIVGGHIAGVVLAHRLALRDAPAARPSPACRCWR